MNTRLVSWAEIQQIALALPGMTEGLSYGTPAMRLRGTLLARLWPEGDVLVLRVGEAERDALIASEPEVYFMTEHYRGSPMVLVRLGQVTSSALQQLFVATWRAAASKRLIAEYKQAQEDQQ